jgi:hypothetical protein
MFIDEILKNISFIDAILIGSATLFFSSLGVLAGVMERRYILWAAICGIALLAYIYRYELEYHWLVVTSSK